VLHNNGISLACLLRKNNNKSSPLSAKFAENCVSWQKMPALTKIAEICGAQPKLQTCGKT